MNPRKVWRAKGTQAQAVSKIEELFPIDKMELQKQNKRPREERPANNYEYTERQLGIKQTPFRMHRHDFIVLKRMLDEDGLKFQHFMMACVQAYLDGSKPLMRVIQKYVELKHVPQRFWDRFSLSQRERQGLLEAIEQEQKKADLVPGLRKSKKERMRDELAEGNAEEPAEDDVQDLQGELEEDDSD